MNAERENIIDLSEYSYFDYLTSEQKQILEGLANGLSNNEIGTLIHKSTSTVANLREHLIKSISENRGLGDVDGATRRIIAEGVFSGKIPLDFSFEDFIPSPSAPNINKVKEKLLAGYSSNEIGSTLDLSTNLLYSKYEVIRQELGASNIIHATAILAGLARREGRSELPKRI